MGFNIGGIFKSIVKTVAPAVISAIQGPATSLLKGVVGDLFTKGASALSNVAGNLPGPFGKLAQNLIGSALPKLTEMAQGGIEKLIQKLADAATSRFAPGVGNVTLPSTAAPERATQLATNNPSASTSSSAATSAPAANPTTSTSSNAATSGASVAGTGSDVPPAPLKGDDAKSIEKQNQFNADMQDYQARLSAMNRYWEMMSNVYKTHDQTARALLGNLR